MCNNIKFRLSYLVMLLKKSVSTPFIEMVLS